MPVVRRIAAALLIAALSPAGAAFAFGQSGARSVTDQQKLAERLGQLGMFELLAGFADQADNPDQARYLLAKSELTHASAMDIPPSRRAELVNDAIRILQSLAAESPARISLPGPAGPAGLAKPEKLLHHYRIVLDLVEAEGLIATRPYAMRMMYLQAGRSDRQAIAELTARAIKRANGLDRDFDNTLIDWRTDLKMLVTVLPDLDALQTELRYKQAWIRFYRALALDDGSEKQDLLRDAIATALRFAAGDDRSGVKYWSWLLAGMCTRELGDDYALAWRRLRLAAASEAGPAVRFQAMFEIARNLAESGDYRRALEAIGRFQAAGSELLGGKRQVEVDVHVAMLKNYVYHRWATSSNDPASVAHRAMADKALLDFYLAHQDTPAVARAFLGIIADKYAGVDDLQQADSLVLLALAANAPAGGRTSGGRTSGGRTGGERTSVRTGGGRTSEKSAESELRTIIERKDDLSRAIAPDAMWQLAILLNDRRANIEAGRLFIKLSREFPAHRLALPAAKNAVFTFNGIIQARRRSGAAIAANLRGEFVAALETLLSRWAGQGDLAKWYFNLGWQRQKLAGSGDYRLMAKAAAAYELVPADRPEWMYARHLALRLRVRLLDAPGSGPSDAKRLADALERYAHQAGVQAGLCRPGQRKADLRRWGALADFWRAKVLYERLDDQAGALVMLRNIPDAWPDSDILPTVWEFEISKLVAQKRTDDAIAKVEAFSKKYPAQAMSLMRMVAGQVRVRIRQMKSSPAQAGRLATYKQVFLRFAKKLYANAVKQGLSAKEKYPAAQMLAEASLLAGQADEAARLFEQCARQDKAWRQAKIDRIDADFDKKIQAARSAGKNADAARRLVQEYFAALGNSAGGRDEGFGLSLAKAVSFLNKANTTSEQSARLKIVIDTLVECLNERRDEQTQAVPIDAINVAGLARSQMAKKNYHQALKYYRELLDGLDRNDAPDLYWSAQLDRSSCLYELFKADKSQMRRLVTLIRQLSLIDSSMGGLSGRFEAISSRAEAATRQGREQQQH